MMYIVQKLCQEEVCGLQWHSTSVCVCACCVLVGLYIPQKRDLGQTDRLHVDVSLSVEAASNVLQLNGVDLTQSCRVRHHRPVHCCICLTEIHTACMLLMLS